MVIRSNLPALCAWRGAKGHQSAIAKSIERISSGYRINRAADDPSGLCASQRMRMQLSGLKVNMDSTAQELSALEIEDGKLASTQNILQRMNELAAKAASGTLSQDERDALDAEYQQLRQLIDTVGNASQSKTMVSAGKDAPPAPGDQEKLVFQGENMDAFLEGLSERLTQVSQAARAKDTEALLRLGAGTGGSDSDRLRLAALAFAKENAALLQSEGGTSGRLYTVTLEGGSLSVSLGVTNGQTLGLGDTSLGSAESAGEAMDAVRAAINRVSAQRGGLGATMSRMEHAASQLATMEENLAASLSRLTDADIAREMMNLTREQILAQATQFMLAHSTQQPQDVLALLKSMAPQ